MNHKLLYLGLGLAAVLLFIVAGIWILAQPYTFHGSLIDPPVHAADFVLTTQDGKPFRLSDQAGKVVLIFFGYSSCPDVCPTTLVEFKKIRAQLGAQADRVRFVFITVDPERDTSERLLDYLAGFDPSFIGLTGAMSDLEPVWKRYGVYRAKQASSSALGYSMEHSSRVYAVDAQGNLRLTYSFGTAVDDIAQDVRHLIQAGGARAKAPDADVARDAAVIESDIMRMQSASRIAPLISP